MEGGAQPASGPAVWFRGRALRSPKAFLHSTHRARPPGETLKRIRPYLARAGVTRVADITGLDRTGVPVTLPVRPNSRTLATAAGKGLDRETAMASGAMESLELWVAEHADPPLHVGSEERLRRDGHAVIGLSEVQLLRAAPPPTPSVVQGWVAGWDVLRQEETLAPVGAVHMAAFQQWPDFRMLGFAAAGSNGLASGNTLLEALCAALYELIERDAIACAQAAGGGRAVGGDLLADDRVADLLERFARAGIRVELEDCTWDTSVPTFQAFLYDLEDRRIVPVRGEGSHLDPRIAAIRALTEAAQSRTVIIAGSRDEIMRRQAAVTRFHRPVPAARPGRTPHAPAPPRESEAGESFEQDVSLMLERLVGAGLDRVFVLDLTPAGWDVAVVRVVVPGLEGYHFDHYSPGRRARRAAAGPLPAAA